MPNKPSPDLSTLANEALDLWQQHLAALAADPKAKADLAAWMEPSRRLLDEWMKKAQTGSHAATAFTPDPSSNTATKAPRAAPAGMAFDDGALRLAQLTLHVAELEKRVAKLETRKPGPARKAAGTSK